MCVERIVLTCETERPVVRCEHRRYSIRGVIHGCFWGTPSPDFVDLSCMSVVFLIIGLFLKEGPSLCRYVVFSGGFHFSACFFSERPQRRKDTHMYFLCLRGGTCETYHPPHVSKCRTRQAALCAAIVLCLFSISFKSPLLVLYYERMRGTRYEYLACSRLFSF